MDGTASTAMLRRGSYLAAFTAAGVGVWLLDSLALGAVLAGGLAVLATFFPPWFEEMGGLWRRLAEGRWAGVLPVAAIVGLTIVLLWPASALEPMVGNDHTFHSFKGWYMAHHLLPKGQISGWSHWMFAGYPAGELYPVGADLWVAAFHFLTLGVLSIPATYSLAFTAFMAFAALSVYVLGARLGGRGVGFLAAVLFLLDPGSFRQGGWHYTVTFGVWPQVLGLAFGLQALARLDALMTDGRLRDFLLMALFVGMAVLTHPMSLLLLGGLVPVFVLVTWLRSERRLRDLIPPVLGAVAIGLLLAAAWLAPFIARRGLTTNYGVAWESLGWLVDRFLQGRLFEGTPALTSVFGAVGIYLAIRGRRPLGTFVALSALALVFFATKTALVDLDLLSVAKAFSKIQYERFLILAKPFWFITAAFAIVQLSAAWRGRSRADADSAPSGARQRWRAALATGLAVAVAFLVVRPGLGRVSFTLIEERPMTASTFPEWDDMAAATAWLDEHLDDDEFQRIAVLDGKHVHELVNIPEMLGVPFVKVGFTPAENYREKTETLDYDFLRRIGVRYLVSRGPKSNKHIEEAARFGRVRVYRVRDPIWEPFELTGPGNAELVSFEDERIVLRVRDSEPESRLLVYVGTYPRWTARVGDEELPVVSRALGRSGINGMEVPAREGDIVLEFRPRRVDRAAAAAGWSGLALLALLALVGGVPWLRRRVAAPVARVYARFQRGPGAHVWTVLALGVVLAGGVALARSQGAELHDGEQLYRFSDHVHSADVWYRGGPAWEEIHCQDWDGERWTCNRRETNWRFVGTTAISINETPSRCIWAHPTGGKDLDITFLDVPLGTAIEGFVAIEDRAVRKKRGAPSVTLSVRIDGDELGKVVRSNAIGKQTFRIETPGDGRRRGDVTFRVTAKSDTWRNFCFDAATVRGEEGGSD